MRRKEITVTAGSAAAKSPVFVPDFRVKEGFQLGLGFKVSSGASLAYTLEYTFDDPWSKNLNTDSSVTWYAATIPAAATGDVDATFTRPVTGLRVVTASSGSGTVTLTILQPG